MDNAEKVLTTILIGIMLALMIYFNVKLYKEINKLKFEQEISTPNGRLFLNTKNDVYTVSDEKGRTVLFNDYTEAVRFMNEASFQESKEFFPLYNYTKKLSQ